MTFKPNNWARIRAFYRDYHADIMRAPTNEWAMDPYAWDGEDMIFLTPIERWFWSDIRACDAVLYPQYPVLDFFVDFANPKAKVAIECDGAAYHTDKEKDAARDMRLRAIGWMVYRISGAHCRQEQDAETGELSIPHRFMQRICDNHNISRNSRISLGSEGLAFEWHSVANSTALWIEMANEARNKARRERLFP